jgi:glycosyltransferase involved in cell wall biosynthesis
MPMNRKKRILLCCEATYLNTGYATYGREVMRRLFNTGKYDLAEFASYGDDTDPRTKEIPWGFYGNLPDLTNKQEVDTYNSVPTNQFGEWQFENVLLDFLPDIVFDIRDFWMIDYQERSPFRRLFNWAIMPTVDAEPQNEQWLSTFSNADAVFAYSDWGRDLLKRESNNVIKCLGSAPPSANAAYTPVENKINHKISMGFDPSMQIVGTIMRNQRRKLFPDLFEAFRKFLNVSGRSDVYLYCHTSYPDLGWDIPKLINRYGLSSKVIFTYVCQHCEHVFPMFFSDARAKCVRCNSYAAGLSNVQKGVSYQDLSKITNTFDLYIQYANSEGFGLPQVEAAACAIPVMSIDYSAMSSVVRKLEGIPLKVKAVYQELETGCNRAVPDNDYTAAKMNEFFNLSEQDRKKLSDKTKSNFDKHYQWDATAKKWEDYFDSVIVPPSEETWLSPPVIHQPLTQVPENLSPREYVQWLIINVLGDPEKLNSYMEARMIRDLNYGMFIQGTGDTYVNEDSYQFVKPQYESFDKEKAYNMAAQLCNHRNKWETQRYNRVGR